MYALNLYRAYILNPGIDRTEAMSCQKIYWPRVRKSVKKEVVNCETFQRTKSSNKKFDKLTAKVAE